MIKNILTLRSTCLRRFTDRFIFSPLLQPPISRCCSYSTYLAHPHPTSFPGTEICPPGHRLHLPAAIPCRTSLRAALRACVCCLIPCPFAPPFSAAVLHPGPCRPLGVCPSRVPPSLLCPAFLPMCCATSRNLLVLGLSGCPFCARMRVQGASTPWQ